MTITIKNGTRKLTLTQAERRALTNAQGILRDLATDFFEDGDSMKSDAQEAADIIGEAMNSADKAKELQKQT